MQADSLLVSPATSLLNGQNLTIFLRFVVILLIGIPVVYILSRWVHSLAKKKFSPQEAMIFQKLVFYTGMTIIVMMALMELNFKVSVLFGAAGIAGIAIGFASQTSVSNIISGLFLIAEKPFQVNDVISVGTITGVVLSIDTLSVKMRTFDNKYIRIPNETLIKSEVINITKFPIRRVDIEVGVAYKEDMARVRKILLDIAINNPLCLNEPEPQVIFRGFGNSSIDFLFAVWAVREDWIKLKNSIAEEIKSRFDAEGIEIPFPHISLYSGSKTEPIPVEIFDARRDSR